MWRFRCLLKLREWYPQPGHHGAERVGADRAVSRLAAFAVMIVALALPVPGYLWRFCPMWIEVLFGCAVGLAGEGEGQQPEA